MSGRALPSGTITFLFTDIEGSTKILRELGTDRYHKLLELHAGVLRRALADGGHEVRVDGDAFFVVFELAAKAVAAAAAAQRAFAAAEFPGAARVRVRMGMHSGEGIPASVEAGADYVGLDVHRAARIAAAAHGGQVLLSSATRTLVRESLPAGVTLRDLGIHRLRDFAEPDRLYQLVVDGLTRDFPQVRGPDEVPVALPTQLTTFIGREREIAEGSRLLAATRLLTLTGPGGTGKTRLALQVAASATPDFPDGTFWVSLAAIRDPELVMPEIASSLHVQEGPQPAKDRVTERLREKSALLVLDNFEQVIAGAPLVTALLRSAPHVKAIVTSRAPLHVQGESELRVPSLTTPDRDARVTPAVLSEHEATRLFVDRAMAIQPEFRVTSENAAAIAEICGRLDGLPLAIELAVARLRLLTPNEVLERLARALDAVASGGRDVPDRQRTLRSAIGWSYDLLDSGARKLFERFSVFAGSPRLQEVEDVCGPEAELGFDVIDTVTALVDQSLVRRLERKGETRLAMLTTIREFAAERLAVAGHDSGLSRRHAAAYIAVAERHAPLLTGASQREHLDELEHDHEDLRAAMDWSSRNDPAMAMRLAFAVWRFWQMRGHLEEARPSVERMMARDIGDDEARLLGLEAAGGVAYWQGDLPTAVRWYEESVSLADRLGNVGAAANARYNLAVALGVQGADMTRARTVLERALGDWRAVGDRAGVARGLVTLAGAVALEGDLAGARAHLEEAARRMRELGDRFGLGYALHQLGLLAVLAGRPADAGGHLREALSIFDAVDDLSGVTVLLGAHAFQAYALGDHVRMATLVGAAAAQRDASGAAVGVLNAPGPLASHVARLLEIAADPAFAAAQERGRAMDRVAAVSFALGSA